MILKNYIEKDLYQKTHFENSLANYSTFSISEDVIHLQAKEYMETKQPKQKVINVLVSSE